MQIRRWLVKTVAAGLALGALQAGAASAASAAGAEPKAPPGATPVDQPTRPPGECDKQFADFDVNRDGRLSYPEFANGRFGLLRFAMAPSEQEVRGFLARYTAIARRADVNRDGWLTRGEHRAICQSGEGP